MFFSIVLRLVAMAVVMANLVLGVPTSDTLDNPTKAVREARVCSFPNEPSAFWIWSLRMFTPKSADQPSNVTFSYEGISTLLHETCVYNGTQKNVTHREGLPVYDCHWNGDNTGTGNYGKNLALFSWDNKNHNLTVFERDCWVDVVHDPSTGAEHKTMAVGWVQPELSCEQHQNPEGELCQATMKFSHFTLKEEWDWLS